MKNQCWQDLVGQAPGYPLRDFCVCRVPRFRLGFDRKLARRSLGAADGLKPSNIDFRDAFEPTLRRLLHMFLE
jgi:hypothetical protein